MHPSCPLPFWTSLPSPPPTPTSPFHAKALVEGSTPGHLRTRLSEEAGIRFIRPRLHLSLRFISRQFLSILLRVTRPSASPPPAPLLSTPPSHHLSFPSMCIFRSRVIKSAPEGLRMNRRALILSQPPSWYSNTNACIHAFPLPTTTLQTCLYFLSFFYFLPSVFIYTVCPWSYLWIHSLVFRTCWSVDGAVRG